MSEPTVYTSMCWSIPILYEDNHLLVAVKPPNLPAQADSSGDADMLTLLKGYIKEKYEKPGSVYLGLVHRLDRPVGGVMVFARTSKAAARLSKTFAQHAQERRYLCVLEGALDGPRTLEDHLRKDPATGMVRVVDADAPGAKYARLDTRPLACRDGLTLAEARLHTGRAHQIRVQHAAAGFPLWGDNRYGRGRPGQQIALWAAALIVKHPTKDQVLRFVDTPKAAGAWKGFESEIGEWEREMRGDVRS